MLDKHKRVSILTISLMGLLVLSMMPVSNSFATTADSIEAGDVLRYSVAKFNVDFTPFNEQPDVPFVINDPTILEGSVLYFKILRESFSEVEYAVGFVLGKDASVQLKKDADWPIEIDTAMLPNFIELPKGAGVPIFAGEYDMDHPFPMDLDPSEIPMVLNPNIDWVGLQDQLIQNWHPTGADYDEAAGTLTATWSQALSSTQEGIESAELIWDQNEGGALAKAAIRGQQRAAGGISEIDVEITYGYTEHIGLPDEAAPGYTAEYVLTDIHFAQSGLEVLAGPEMIDGIKAQMDMMEGQTVLELEVTDVDGLFVEFESTGFPDNSELRQGPEMVESMAFGMGIPFLTPDWDFYTSVWATGNLLTETYLDLIEAVKPAELPDLDIDQLLVNLKTAKSDGFRYFGFTLAEEVAARDPESGVVINTEANAEGWVAYEENGIFAGLYLEMSGSVSTSGLPLEQGGNLDVEFDFSAKVDRKDADVPDDPSLDEPEFTPPPSSTDLTQPDTTDGDGDGGDGAFIPGFDVVASIAAIVGLTVIIRRRRRS